jgi:hypothetical protein
LQTSLAVHADFVRNNSPGKMRDSTAKKDRIAWHPSVALRRRIRIRFWTGRQEEIGTRKMGKPITQECLNRLASTGAILEVRLVPMLSRSGLAFRRVSVKLAQAQPRVESLGSGLAIFPFRWLFPASELERHRHALGAQFIRDSAVNQARATTIPPMDNAAMACAVTRRWRPFWIKLRSKTLTIALNTVSNARRAVLPLRATSVGNATIGQEFSTSSKCGRDR